MDGRRRARNGRDTKRWPLRQAEGQPPVDTVTDTSMPPSRPVRAAYAHPPRHEQRNQPCDCVGIHSPLRGEPSFGRTSTRAHGSSGAGATTTPREPGDPQVSGLSSIVNEDGEFGYATIGVRSRPRRRAARPRAGRGRVAEIDRRSRWRRSPTRPRRSCVARLRLSLRPSPSVRGDSSGGDLGGELSQRAWRLSRKMFPIQ